MNYKQQSERTAVQGRTHSPCRSCGKPVQLQGRAAFFEPSDEVKRTGTSQHVWHRECFDAYLEEGEET